MKPRAFMCALLPAFAIALLGTCPTAGAAVEPWGTLGNLRVAAGTGSGQVHLREQESSVAVDSADGSFYVADTLTNEKTQKREVRLQRFNAQGKAEPSTPVTFKVKGNEEAGELQGVPELAVDPSRNRVYVLTRYWRRGENAAEEKEEQKEEEANRSAHKGQIETIEAQLKKTLEEQAAHKAPVEKLRAKANEELEKGERAAYERDHGEAERLAHEARYEEEERNFSEKLQSLKAEIFNLQAPKRREPLDSEEYVAGALYAYEVSGGKLVAANTANKGVVIEGELGAESETAKKALLNPLGLAVDAKSGNVVLLGVQDQQEKHDAVAQDSAEKECRVAAQWLTISGSPGSVVAKAARRYVDTANVIGHAFHAAGEAQGKGGCGGYAQEEPAEWQAYTPVLTPGGRLLAMSTNGENEEEGDVWELPGLFNEEQAEQSTTPAMLYSYPVENRLAIETGAEEAYEAIMSPAMSLLAKPGSEKEGKLYLGARYEEAHPPAETGQINGVLVLHYSEPEGAGHLTVGEEGYVTGFHAFETAEHHVKKEESEAEFKKGQCGLPSPGASVGAGLGSGIIPVGAFLENGKEAVLELSSGARDELVGVRLAPGANAAECLATAVHEPVVIVGSVEDPVSISAGTEALLEADVLSGPAKSVRWEFRYKAGGKTEEEAPVVQTQAELAALVKSPGEAGTVTRIKHVFAHEGEYEITVTALADGSNLVSPAAEPTASRKQKVALSLGAAVLTMKSIYAGEAASDIQAQLTDPNIGEHVRYRWLFGDGTSGGERELTIAKATTTTPAESHIYSTPCSCNVTLEILSPVTQAASRAILVRERPKEEPKEEPKETLKETPREVPPPGGGGVLPYKEGSAVAKLAASSLTVNSRGAVSIIVTCAGGAKSCSGRITLQTLTAVAASTRKKKRAKKAILTLATGSFTVLAGQPKKLTLHLSSRGRVLLAHSHVLRARATLLAHNSEGAIYTTKSVLVLRLARAKKKHH